MFTRSNFDIKHELICGVCEKAIATRVSTNTVSTSEGKVFAHSTAFCIDCWNVTIEDENTVEVERS